jgi:hypothetical protein
MKSEEKYLELRIAYPGHPYVAVLGRRSSEYGFERIFNPFYKGREFLLDGRQEQIHHLPAANLVYEIDELRDGKRARWYAATLEDDPNIYRISRRGAEVFASRIQTLRQVIEEYPERPNLADFHDDED